ncbi:MAG: hypothetical protein KatS3mg085_340 [Candidatus Dojkabacteria bacterium]|nr:MAG: hypothetical protein KatS3mg085_340 [Candidatus Dojkabacteria bacterium]
MKKVILLAEIDYNSYSSRRFREECNKKNIAFEHFKYSDIIIEFRDNKLIATAKGKNVLDGTHYIFRSSGSKYKHLSQSLRNYLQSMNKIVLNGSFKYPFSLKLDTYAKLSLYNVPIINTHVFPTIEALEQNAYKIKFPVILKHSSKSLGMEIYKVNSLEELKSKLNDHISKYMFQDFVDTGEIKESYRIITLGYEIIGGYKRIAKKNAIVTNSGSAIEKVHIAPNMYEICKLIIKATGLEFSGIDIIYKDEKPLVLEVNSSPGFKAFEEITKINLAEKILNYLLSKS